MSENKRSGKPSDTSEAPRDDQPYDAVQGSLETTEEIYREVEDAVDTAVGPDREEVAERLLEEFREIREEIDDAAEQAEEAGDPTELSAAPAETDFLQGTATGLEHLVDAEADFDGLQTALEGVEDILEDVDYGAETRWYARVNGTPLLYDRSEVPAEELIEDGRNPDTPRNYILKAWATEEQSSKQGEFDPEHDDKVPLDEGITEFTTERNAGGGQV